MFVTIPTFTIFNKIKVVVRLCGQLAGHECGAPQPKLRRRSNAALPLGTNFPRAYKRQIFHRPIGLVPF